jgi:hypothetical protein
VAIYDKLGDGTKRTLAAAKKKLFCKDQLDRTRVLFCGGGHSTNPYAEAVLRQFSCELFSRPVRPEEVGLPMPSDLEMNQSNAARWMPRLSVAYGLSFDKADLATYTYPKELNEPGPERRQVFVGHAASKEEC